MTPFFVTQVKLSCDALQETQEEWSSSSSEAESCKAVSKWLQESQEATKELLRVKDHLIKVERNVSSLLLVPEGSIPLDSGG